MPNANQKVVRWFPGATLAGASLAMPTGVSKIEAIIGAYILRLSSAITVSEHAPVDVAVSVNHTGATLAGSVANHAAADVAASVGNHLQAAIVAALDDHPIHAHDLVSVGTGAPPAGGNAGLPAGLNAFTDSAAAVPHTLPGNDASGGNVRNNAAAQAHAAALAVAHGVGGATVNHAAGGAASAHNATATPVSHVLVGANQIVAATATKVSNAHITLNVPTNVFDLLVVTFHEEGSMLKVA